MIAPTEATEGKFGFGLEAEFLLLDKLSHEPLFYQDLNFAQLLDLLDAIPTEDFSSDGFNIKPLHRLASPYLVEGYYLTDAAMKPLSLLAKGVELRTPIAASMDQSVEHLKVLYARLQTALRTLGYEPAILSHHPVQSKFDAPPNYTRHDYWQWALTAMTTMGPDINISIPGALAQSIDLDRLHEKINYYMPSLVGLSLASPIVDGDLWRIRGVVGKSIRTYRRSLWAPLYYIHKEPALRFEFKGFEMATCLDDYKAFFLLCLPLLLDPTLDGRASDSTRIFDLGHIAVTGVEASFVKERAEAVLLSAEKIALDYGFNRSPLDAFWHRLATGRLPADDLVDLFNRAKSIPAMMGSLTDFTDGSPLKSPKAETETTLCLK
ncbi:MAG: hypothetical protein JSS83_26410 [Cyanobacteria bacterium SZAS LIN-3]|nr:hypothetical protein [Cyanobacteria bacterium SZAS LIN-3]